MRSGGWPRVCCVSGKSDGWPRVCCVSIQVGRLAVGLLRFDPGRTVVREWGTSKDQRGHRDDAGMGGSTVDWRGG